MPPQLGGTGLFEGYARSAGCRAEHFHGPASKSFAVDALPFAAYERQLVQRHRGRDQRDCQRWQVPGLRGVGLSFFERQLSLYLDFAGARAFPQNGDIRSGTI